MRLDTTFRLSFYVTLALACGCLAQAETFFVFWFPFVCLPLAAAVFVLAWRHEGRWIIHDPAANYLGIGIGMATVSWIILQLPRSEADLAAGGVPMPAGLLPHLGLLLYVLLGVKLFRPKTLADFWTIQTMGLMIVTLGCVLAGDVLFMVLMLAYLASLVWSLALFQLYRGNRLAGTGPLFDMPGADPLPAALPAALPWRHLGITRALRWSLVVAAVGLPLFMLMPRSGTGQWVPQKLASAAATSMNVGVDPGINLNRIGTIELSAEPAFHVSVSRPDGKPARLPLDQRWRVEVLDFYMNGYWITWVGAVERQQVEPPDKDVKIIEPVMPPKGGPGQRFVRFRVHPLKAGGLALAEPVDLRYIGLNALAGDGPPGIDPFKLVPGDAAKNVPVGRRMYQYTQVLTGDDAMERMPARFTDEYYRTYLARQHTPEAVATWARRQLAQLPRMEPVAHKVDKQGHVAPEHHEAVSKALCHYFAHSGDYRYSLTLKRHSGLIDPTADFLLNTKEGHCERFAAALTLALRGLGVPARIVKGYRGAEENDEPGKYTVRLDQAHSWVQVLLRDNESWTWLTLDPTPGGAGESNPLVTWIGWLRDLDAERLWRRYVLNYNGDVQAGVIVHLWQSATGRHLLWQIPACGAGLAMTLFAWRRRGALARAWRRRERSIAAPGYYRRLLRVLAHGFDLRPTIGQTPREFAACATAMLQRDSAAAAWAMLPVRAAEALYRERFAGRPLSALEADELTVQLQGLEKAAQRKR